jgi:hypothetical protein
MVAASPGNVRKRLLQDEPTATHAAAGEIDIARTAMLAYSSEHPDHPVEHLLDRRGGPGGTRWRSARPDVTEQILLEFEQPQSLARLAYEAEETEAERTQEVRVDVSSDGGATYRQAFVQDYVFSPRGATFQREELSLRADRVTHLRLTIVPNKSGSGTATLTSLRLFS